MSDFTVSKKKMAGDAIKVFGTLILVKLIGVIKQSFIAAYYGAGDTMDSYLVANDFLGEIGVVIFSSLSVSLLNFYLLNKKKGKNESQEFIGNVFTVFLIISACLAGIAILLSTPVSFILAPGFSPQQRAFVAQCIMILAVTLINSCLSNIFTAVLEAEKSFVPGKLSGLIQSGCIIAGCVIFSNLIGIYSLLFSFIVYNVLQNIFLFINCRKYIKIKLRRPRLTGDIKTIIRQSVPLFISNSAIQVNAMVDKAIASGLGSGIVSTLSYSGFIMSSVHSIFVGGICSVMYSNFSSCAAEEDYEKMRSIYKKGMYIFMMILVPIILFVCENSFGIVRLLYMRGAFTENDAKIASGMAIAYLLGILFAAIRDISAYYCYAHQNMTGPMINTIVTVGVNICSSIVLSQILGGFGVALGTSIGNLVGMIMMLITVRKYNDNPLELLDMASIIKFALGGVAGFFAMWGVNILTANIHYIPRLIISFGVLALVYLGVLLLTRCGYVKEVFKMVKRR